LIADLAVVVASAAIATLSIGAFFADLGKAVGSGEREPIGTVTYKRLQAQRRYADRVVWESVTQESPVYAMDFVRTSSGSEAVISLSDGTTIDLYENTMIQLEWSEDATVSFVSGNVVASNAGGSARIRAGDSVLAIDSASASIESVKVGESIVAVAKGSIKVESSSGKSDVRESEVAKLSAAKVEVRKSPIADMSPRSGSVVEIPEARARIGFSWRPSESGEGKRYELEIASSASFASPVARELVSGTSYEAELPAGAWFWRVRPAGETRWDAPTVAFSVRSRVAIKAVAPGREAVYEFRKSLPSVNFAWQGPESSTYLLEVSANPDVSAPKISRKLRSTSLSVDLPGEGVWYWRVTRVVSAASYEVSTATETRTIVVRKLDSLEAATIRSPGAKVSTIAAYDSGIVFSWRMGRDAVRSELVIARDASFRNVIATRAAGGSTYWVEKGLVAPGTYYFKVRTWAEEGDEAPEAVGVFAIVDSSDAISPVSPVDGFVAQGDKVPILAFSWQSDVSKPLRLEVASDKGFSNVVASREAMGVAFVESLPVGTYWWRVRYDADDGKTVAAGPIRTLTITGKLPAPSGVEPSATLRLSNATDLLFSWTAVPGARYYDLELWKDGAWLATFSASALETTTYSYRKANELGTGTFVVKLRARAPAGPASSERESEWSEARFIIESNRFMAAPEALYPAGGTVDGLEALKRGFKLSFRADRTASYSVVTVAKDAAFRQVVLQTRSSSFSVQVPRRFQPGAYYLKVESFAADGFASPPTVATFAVARPPELSAAVALAPPSGDTVDAYGLGALTLRWKEVPGATHYTVRIVDPLSGKVAIAFEKVVDTQVIIEDLSPLAAGPWLWTVEAMDVADDGAVDRTSTASFALTLTLSKVPVAPVLAPAVIYEE
jgi:hypothetical protein